MAGYFAKAQKGSEKVAGHLAYFEVKKCLALISNTDNRLEFRKGVCGEKIC